MQSIKTARPFAWPEGKRAAVSLTFDDARPSQLDRGVPILHAYGIRATFYVIPRNMEPRREDWRRAVAAGHEAGNHTVVHPCSGNFPWSRSEALEDYSLEMMADQLDEASRAIEELVETTPRTFAYPCGQKFVGRGTGTRSYVPLVAERFLVGRGFRDEAPNDPTYCDLAQAAGVDGDGLSFDECRRWVDRTVQEGAWLILAGHDVGEGGRQTVLAGALDEFCRYCQRPDSGIWIDTVAAVAGWISR